MTHERIILSRVVSGRDATSDGYTPIPAATHDDHHRVIQQAEISTGGNNRIAHPRARETDHVVVVCTVITSLFGAGHCGQVAHRITNFAASTTTAILGAHALRLPSFPLRPVRLHPRGLNSPLGGGEFSPAKLRSRHSRARGHRG